MNDIIVALITAAGAVLAASLPLWWTQKGKAADAEHARLPIVSWIVMHLVATTVVAVIIALSGGIESYFTDVLTINKLTNWAFFGALIGSAQWLVLDRIGLRSIGWIPASIVGWIVFPFIPPLFIMVNWAVCGIVAAALQWLALHRTLSGSARWIGVNVIAWFAAGILSFTVGVIIDPIWGFGWAWLLGWASVGFIGGALTLFGIRSLSPQATPEMAA